MRIELILVLLLSVFADRFLGEPPDRFHPTVFMGRAIDYLDKKLSSGLLIHLAVALFFSSIAFTLLYFSAGPIKIVLAAAILKTSYSWRGLKDYTLPIAKNLEQNELVNARRKIPFIAGRNPEALDRRGVISTVVESIAEGSVDSVISPLLFFAFFSLNGLETGVAASVFYRVTNTLDSMLGVPGNQKGLFSAKTDELFNFIQKG
jgi:adenosylcobinamide-phosphate synthase